MTPRSLEMKDLLQINRDTRKEILKEIERIFSGVNSKCVGTFDTHAIQIIIFPPSGHMFTVPGGPHTAIVRDGLVEE